MRTVGSELERSRASADAAKACPSCGTRYSADALFCSFDGAPLTTSPSIIAAAAATDPYLEREILGHIEIRQLVGIGAMGRVYRAFQKGIDRDVAVKVLHRELSSNQTLVARFHREAKVASRLAHPNVVHVLLAGQLPDGAMYIVMEYLDGMSLQSALAAAGGAMPLPRALHVALQLCDAAGEGHTQGIVHRDVKPENVMLVNRADDPDFVKILDFGIARLHWGEQSMATSAGLIFGTARYISPEGAKGEQVGPAGDVYSIATMLYQMLSGRTPFDAEQAVALLVQQIHDPPTPLGSIPRAAYVPDPIAAVIMRNLSKKPDERAANGRAFGRALLEAAVMSGMSAQEILARSAQLGGRGSNPSAVQLPSKERTQQLSLDGDTATRVGASSTAFETPGPTVIGEAPASARSPARTEIPDWSPPPSGPVAPGATTTRWSPPADFEKKILPPPPSRASRVDSTMADEELATSGTPTVPPSRSRTPPSRSKPPSSVDATIAGEEVAPAPKGTSPAQPPAHSSAQRPLVRGLLLVVLCFLVGVLGMTGVAWRVGLVARTTARSAPPDEGRQARAVVPSEPAAPPPPEASAPPLPPLDLSVPRVGPARVASSSAAASAGLSPPARVVLDVSSGQPGVGQPVDFIARVVGSPSPGAPGSRAKVDGARFRISGPGIAEGTELPVPDDGSGVFRTTFTFLQGGRFEVAFNARADGSPIRGYRPVVVGAVDPPPQAPQAPQAQPAPTARPPQGPSQNADSNMKWM